MSTTSLRASPGTRATSAFLNRVASPSPSIPAHTTASARLPAVASSTPSVTSSFFHRVPLSASSRAPSIASSTARSALSNPTEFALALRSRSSHRPRCSSSSSPMTTHVVPVPPPSTPMARRMVQGVPSYVGKLAGASVSSASESEELDALDESDRLPSLASRSPLGVARGEGWASSTRGDFGLARVAAGGGGAAAGGFFFPKIPMSPRRTLRAGGTTTFGGEHCWQAGQLAAKTAAPVTTNSGG